MAALNCWEQHAVGQPGDGVVVGQPLQLGLVLTQLAVTQRQQALLAVELGDEQAEQAGGGQGKQEQRRGKQIERRPAAAARPPVARGRPARPR
jgi:hypothetical protein